MRPIKGFPHFIEYDLYMYWLRDEVLRIQEYLRKLADFERLYPE